MQCSLHQFQMCEKGAVTPDMSCTVGRQSTTTVCH